MGSPAIYLLVAILGLIFGSFLNVCISRIPAGESIVLPASHCPQCGQAIRWYDNIPLISYVVLGGRCRDCRQGISLVYPVVEALTSVVLVAGFLEYGLSLIFLKYALLSMLLIVLTFTDLTVRRLPHQVTIFGMAAGLLLSLFVPITSFPLGWVAGRLGITLPWRVRFAPRIARRSAFWRWAFLRGGRSIRATPTQAGVGIWRCDVDGDDRHLPGRAPYLSYNLAWLASGDRNCGLALCRERSLPQGVQVALWQLFVAGRDLRGSGGE